MKKHILEVSILGPFVLLSGEPDHAMLIAIDSERVNPYKEDIDSEIILESIYQIRVCEVGLDDHRVILVMETLWSLSNSDTCSLTHQFWFDYICGLVLRNAF